MYRKFLNDIVRSHQLRGVETDDLQLSHSNCLAAPQWIFDGPLYEIFVRNFTRQGTIAEIEQQLEYLENLGVKTLWLMPFHPIGREQRKGSMGSPYAIRDYRAIDPQLGTEEDLKRLVRSVHQRDMRLIIDIVANHAATDHIWLETNTNFFLSATDASHRRKLKDWTDVLDLNYEQPELRQRMKDILRYWIEEFDIDGYRCDVAGMVPLDFWQDVTDELLRIKPDMFMLAEWESPRLHTDSFHATYDWTTLAVLKDIYQGRRPASECLEWITQKEMAYPKNSLFLRFTENHDLPRTRKVFGSESFYPFVVFHYALPGIPLLSNGQEVGLEKMPDQFNHDPLEWERGDKKIREFYGDLIRWRKTYSALSSDQITALGNNQQDKVTSFMKHDQQYDILVILNFSAQELCVQVDISAPNPAVETYSDLFSNGIRKREALEQLLIKPYGYYLFKVEKTGSF